MEGAEELPPTQAECLSSWQHPPEQEGAWRQAQARRAPRPGGCCVSLSAASSRRSLSLSSFWLNHIDGRRDMRLSAAHEWLWLWPRTVRYLLC